MPTRSTWQRIQDGQEALDILWQLHQGTRLEDLRDRITKLVGT